MTTCTPKLLKSVRHMHSGGDSATWLHDESKYPAAATLMLAPERHGEIDALLQLAVRGAAARASGLGIFFLPHHRSALPIR